MPGGPADGRGPGADLEQRPQVLQPQVSVPGAGSSFQPVSCSRPTPSQSLAHGVRSSSRQPSPRGTATRLLQELEALHSQPGLNQCPPQPPTAWRHPWKTSRACRGQEKGARRAHRLAGHSWAAPDWVNTKGSLDRPSAGVPPAPSPFLLQTSANHSAQPPRLAGVTWCSSITATRL